MRNTLDTGLCMVAAVAVAVLAALTACSPPASDSAGKLPLILVQDVPLPGGSTRLDYQVIDPAAKRLYITHLGDGTVHVLDLAGPAVVATIDGVSSVHGIALAPESYRVLASASGTDEAVIIDTDTLGIGPGADRPHPGRHRRPRQSVRLQRTRPR